MHHDRDDGEYSVVSLHLPGCGGCSLGLAGLAIIVSMTFRRLYRLFWGVIPAFPLLYGLLASIPLLALAGLVTGLVGLRGSNPRAARWGILVSLVVLGCAIIAIVITRWGRFW